MESNRRSRLSANVRPSEAFSVNCEGPTIEFLPAVPHCPASGAVYAAGFRVPSGRSRLHRNARRVGPYTPRHSGAHHIHTIDGTQRKAAARVDLGGQRPSLERRAPPAAQQSSAAHAHAGRILRLQSQQMPLVEGRRTAFRAQVQPVLRDHAGALPPAAERRVVERLRVSVLCRRREAVMQAPPQLKLPALARRIAVRGHVHISRRAGGTGVNRACRVGVRQEFLYRARTFDAVVGGGRDHRRGQIHLRRDLPVLRVADAEVRVDGEGVRRNPRRRNEPVGQRQADCRGCWPRSGFWRAAIAAPSASRSY